MNPWAGDRVVESLLWVVLFALALALPVLFVGQQTGTGLDGLAGGRVSTVGLVALGGGLLAMAVLTAVAAQDSGRSPR
jgi:hypothetical protein